MNNHLYAKYDWETILLSQNANESSQQIVNAVIQITDKFVQKKLLPVDTTDKTWLQKNPHIKTKIRLRNQMYQKYKNPQDPERKRLYKLVTKKHETK